MVPKFSTAVGVIAATALIPVSAASAATIRGEVVHVNKSAHSFTVADRHGHLSAIHANRTPAAGRIVTVSARWLRNGTFAASRIHSGRRSKHVHIRGLVTYVDPSRRLYVVSARGVSLVVHARHTTARTGKMVSSAMLPSDTLPVLGTEVTVNGSLDNQGDIQGDSVNNDGQNTNTADLEGQILSIDPTARTLTISASDDNEITGATILIHIPDTLDITSYHVGDVIQLVATLETDGSYTAVGTSEDNGIQEADGQNNQQGDDQQDNTDQSTTPSGDQSATPSGDQTAPSPGSNQ